MWGKCTQNAEKLRVGMEEGHSRMTGQIPKGKALLSHQDGEGCKGWARTCMQHPEMYPTGSAKVLVGKVLSYFGSRRSNQSNLEEISPEYSLEGLMLKLQLQYFGHLMWRTDIWKDPDAGKDWRQEEKGMDDRGWDSWMASPTRWTWVWTSSGSWWWTGKSDVLQSMGS